MSTLLVRQATAADAKELTALVHASSAYQGMYAPIIAGYEVSESYIARHEVYCAVEAAGRILGFYSLILDPPELDLAFVVDDAQGRGVGRLLMAHMTEQAQAAGLTEVRVVAHPPAEGFYRRAGAQRVGTVAPSYPKVTWERPELRFVIG